MISRWLYFFGVLIIFQKHHSDCGTLTHKPKTWYEINLNNIFMIDVLFLCFLLHFLYIVIAVFFLSFFLLCRQNFSEMAVYILLKLSGMVEHDNTSEPLSIFFFFKFISGRPFRKKRIILDASFLFLFPNLFLVVRFWSRDKKFPKQGLRFRRD